MADERGLEWCIVHEDVFDRFYNIEAFFNAVKIWLERPQVINRRLAGSYIFQSFQTTKNVEILVRDVFALSEESGPIPHEKLLKLEKKIGETIPCDIATQNNVVQVQIRKLLPRQSSKYKNVSEIVIQDTKNKTVMFIPFEDETSTQLVSKIENAYKVSLYSNSEKSSLVLSVLYQEEKADGITCPTVEWLKCCLLPKLYKWMNEDSLNINSFGSSLRLVSIEKYTERYETLKKKYKHFVKMWPERTDPHKFVYEDVAIATYLLLLWENSPGDSGTLGKVQTFVDLGCGNGLLVHILTNEGHIGKGIDLRSRKVWSFYDEKTDLEVSTLDPSTLTYPDVDWIIGNHSDELTPWIPVIAARSSFHCNYFVLPCCFHDFYFKFQRVKANNSQYRSYLNYVQTVGKTCGFDVKEDVLRIPSTKKVCHIGQDRTYPFTNQNLIEENITVMLQNTRYLNKNENSATCKLDAANEVSNNMEKCCPGDECSFDHLHSKEQRLISEDFDKVSRVENVSGKLLENEQNPGTLRDSRTSNIPYKSSETFQQQTKPEQSCKDSTSCQENEMKELQQSFTKISFIPRCEKEPVRNCTQLDKYLLENIRQKVATELLSRCENCEQLNSENPRTWNKGGSMKLSEVSHLFDQTVLDKLRCEAGGIQTVLRNYHQVFVVQHGEVKIRDWQQESNANNKNTKRKSQNEANTSKYWKSKECWFYNHHPYGCPLQSQQCSYAHGSEDLKKTTC